MPADREDVAVLKFGGSSFIELSDYRRVGGYLISRAESARVLVVVSGMSGTTGRLLEAAQSIDPGLEPEVQDQILATAEMLSASFLRAALARLGCPAIDLWAPQIGIQATGPATRAEVSDVDPGPVRRALATYPVVVVTGGQAVTDQGRITMLGRNSSDLTAVTLAAALGTARCEIFSDVPGVYSADPRVVPAAELMPRVSYAQCVAMGVSGAKVLHPGSVLAGQAGRVRIVCRALSAGDGPAEALTGTVVGRAASQSFAVVGARQVRLARLADAGSADAAIDAARRSGLLAVQVPDSGGVVVAVAGAAADLQDCLVRAGIDSTVRTDHGLVCVISPDGQAERELVPLVRLDERVGELHNQVGRQRPGGELPWPAVRKSPHSGLLIGDRQ